MERHSKNNIIFSALELAKIGFFRYLFDGTILDFDQTSFDFFELEGIFKDPQSLVGQKIETLLIYTAQKRKLRDKIRKKGKVIGFEYGFKTLKGNKKWGIHNSFVVIDEEAGKEAIQVCFYNITRRKQQEIEKQKLISELKEAQKELKKSHRELEQRVNERTADLAEKRDNLKEINIALRVLLSKREEDKKEIEKNVLANVEKLISPIIERLKVECKVESQQTFLQILESNLDEITSPMMNKHKDIFSLLTTAQIQIANLIKQGHTTKEIASLLKLSPSTVACHRQEIRKRLSLYNKKANLQTFFLKNS